MALLLRGKGYLALLKSRHFLLDALLLCLAQLPCTDRSKEWFEVAVKVLFSDTKVPLKQSKKLLLHEVDLGQAEAKIIETADGSVSCPVLVLWGRVVEILCSKDKRCKEDAVRSTFHSLCNWRQALLESGQVDKRSHQGGDLHVRSFNQCRDEQLQRWESRLIVGAAILSGWGGRWCWW